MKRCPNCGQPQQPAPRIFSTGEAKRPGASAFAASVIDAVSARAQAPRTKQRRKPQTHDSHQSGSMYVLSAVA